MPEIGNSLREARIRRGLSIKDVEDSTKIRSKYLEALEEDDFEVLPGSTFVKAFLRTYASFLKLDADTLIDEYRSSYEPRKDESTFGRTDVGRQGQPRSSSGAERKKQRAHRGQRGYALLGILAVVAVVLLAWFGSGRGQDAASLDASSLGGSTTTVSLSDVSSTTTSTSAGASTTGQTQATTDTEGTSPNDSGGGDGGNVTLVVRVTEGSCWLVVHEDSQSGAEIYAGTLSAGGQQTFDTSKRYWMMVGNPEDLAVSVNGASYVLAEPAGAFIVTETGIERSQ